jgi:hypothetical protein
VRAGLIRIRSSWLVAGAIIIPALLVLDALLYYPALLRSGTLPTNADSIGIPIYQSGITALVSVPVLLIYALPALWRYRGDAGLWEYPKSNSLRLFLSRILYALPAILLVCERVYFLSQRLPAYEYIDFIVVVPLLIWLLMLRAAMAAPRAFSVSHTA